MISLLEAIRNKAPKEVRRLLTREMSFSLLFQAFSQAIEVESLEIVQILLDTGVDINLVSSCGTPLKQASEAGLVEIVQALLQHGANPNVMPCYPEAPTALMLAAQSGNLKIVQLLVTAGAEVNEVRGGDYALLSAAVEGFQDIFDYLAPFTNQELREIAAKQLSEGIRQKHRREAADPLTVTLSQAVFAGNLNQVQEILTQGIELSSFDEEGCTPLCSAVVRRNPDLVKILLDAGASPDLSDDMMVQTPLTEAIGWSEEAKAICSLLINAGADVNLQTIDGMTVLMQAARFGNLEIVQILLQAGANVSIQDCEGRTALDYALHYSQENSWYECNQYPELIKILQEASVSSS